MTQKAQALIVPDGRSTKSSIVAKLKLADLELTLYSGCCQCFTYAGIDRNCPQCQ